jgi:hypothetical protein
MYLPGTLARAFNCVDESGVPSTICDGLLQLRLTSRFGDVVGRTIEIEPMVRPGLYLRLPSCVTVIVQIPEETALKLLLDSNVQTSEGPTETLIGVEVLDVTQSFCGGSSVNMTVGGTSSGF